MLADVVMTLPRWPIVGRRPELEVFERALGSGERAGLVIYGRAGVGKTRLADECAGQAAASGHPTQRIAGSRTTALLPLGAVAALLPDGLGRLGPDEQVNAVAMFEQTRRSPRPPPGDRGRRRGPPRCRLAGAARVPGRAAGDLPDRHRAHRRAGSRPADRPLAGRPAAADRPARPEPRPARHASPPGPRRPDRGRCGAGVLGILPGQPAVRARAGPGRPGIGPAR